jgi:hypothetical protein
MKSKRFTALLAVFGLFLATSISSNIFAQQTDEPELAETDPMRSYTTENIKGALALNVMVNNFGLSVGGEYRKIVGPFSELYVTAQISGLRDVREQTFQLFGQQIIPNKHNRAFSFPLMFGVRHRFFPNAISDNFRLNLSAALGPALIFAFPYYRDRNNNGVRDVIFRQDLVYEERINDVFAGWSSGSWLSALSGELNIGVDLGRKFEKLNGVKFGFQFYYVPDGIQMMEPFTALSPVYDISVSTSDAAHGQLFSPLYDRLKFFGTPQITFLFGKMW